eukprot:Awhi_evm1s9885
MNTKWVRRKVHPTSTVKKKNKCPKEEEFIKENRDQLTQLRESQLTQQEDQENNIPSKTRRNTLGTTESAVEVSHVSNQLKSTHRRRNSLGNAGREEVPKGKFLIFSSKLKLKTDDSLYIALRESPVANLALTDEVVHNLHLGISKVNLCLKENLNDPGKFLEPTLLSINQQSTTFELSYTLES